MAKIFDVDDVRVNGFISGHHEILASDVFQVFYVTAVSRACAVPHNVNKGMHYNPSTLALYKRSIIVQAPSRPPPMQRPRPRP